ncbi:MULTISPECIES: MurR/RpiR family transcriptional regulator [Virgibacillus]|uniref:Glv operon regulatory protein n=2 Tax=Virgibacillus TaxID=84406 RepID=A0A024Q8B9_9BACI|nr:MULTISPECIES: MurR/RpiR family transcriptional regulator [Virgibacillus]EQB37680.1 hypothetical protein M948_03755 [Virgibacillus sp. CM-4]MYL40419.1 SIS domain-containing protein [Virgibacillus massiliensis]GGJ59101.1 RpiR family transcriptional regulator [Virgibacillus kapii]CDQ38793.1 Glv operon regulatory protein [Virgibacillus massiliensis]
MFSDNQISHFSELEYSLYNFIMNHLEKVQYMRIRELAKETHVSTTSILRFCKKIDCDGFSEFKIKLKLYLKEAEQLRMINTTTSLSEFLERTLQHDYQTKIYEIANHLVKAKNLIFIGIGTSGILAEYGARYFSALRKFSLHIKDPFFPIHPTTFEDSVALILSVSGETDHVLNLTNQMKQRGSTVVSITNHSDCTLAKISDYNLAYFVTPEYRKTYNLTTQIPVIHFLESLAKATYEVMQRD